MAKHWTASRCQEYCLSQAELPTHGFALGLDCCPEGCKPEGMRRQEINFIEIVKPGGRVVTYGATTGPVKEVVLRTIFWKQLSVLGTTMGAPREFAAMLQLYDDGGLRPVVDRVFPLDEAADAHRRMEEAEQFGKIVLRIAA